MATTRGMDIAMNITGVDDVHRAAKRTADTVHRQSANAVRASCARIVRIAKAIAPVRTGALQKAITYRLSGTLGSVGVVGTTGPAIYWRFVEFGTRHAPAKPFFRPAAEAGKGPFKDDMRAMGRVLERGTT